MSTRNLDALLRPRSVAVIGASNQPGAIGAILMRNLLASGFAGPIMPVNPKYKAVAGVLAYPDVARLPEAPDLAIIGTPPATVPGLVRDLGARGSRAAAVLTSGLDRERDANGTPLRQAVLDAARPYRLRVLGPNSVGLMVADIGLNASYAHTGVLPGGLAFLTESAGLATAVLDYAASGGIGFSHFVCVGDSADVDFADLIDVLGAEPVVKAILLYMESVPNARKFLSAARAAARGKPVLVVKAGRAGGAPREAGFHAAALANADAVFDAAVRRAGILRVATIQELFDAVETLARTRPLKGERLAIVTNGRSPGVMAADALRAGGGRLAELAAATKDRLAEVLPDTWAGGNPVDVEENASAERQIAALEIVLDDPGTDAVLFIHEPVAVVDSTELAEALVETMRRGRRDVLACWLGRRSVAGARRVFTEAGIATYDSPEHAVGAFLQMDGYRRSQLLLMQTPTSTPEAFRPDTERARAIIAVALAEDRALLSEPEAKAVLAAYRVPVAAPADTHRRVDSKRVDTRRAAHGPQKLARQAGAHELFVGASCDAVFGPVVVFGHGGTAVDVIADATVMLPPLNTVLAASAVARTRVSRLLAGAPGRPAADLSAVYLTLVQIAQLVADIPEIVDIDVNPLLADEAGVEALDVRMRIAATALSGADRLSIRPYPRELEEAIVFQGRPVVLRPIRPEDAPQHKAFFDHLAPEDVRYRFFRLLRDLTQAQLSRFTQIDYDREMAFIAAAEDATGAAETLGVVRAVIDPDHVRAEFAVIVRSDLKGRGLGRVLLDKMIRYCRDRGLGELASGVLVDNRAMRDLARSLGFREVAGEDDDTVDLCLELRGR